jgi:hypothetical protein
LEVGGFSKTLVNSYQISGFTSNKAAFLYPEDGGSRLFQNVDKYLPVITVSHPRSHYGS